MDKLNLDHHISQQFNVELEEVRNQVLVMGGLVEEQIMLAMEALVEGDSAKGDRVVENDNKVNDIEVSIDEDCSRILARRQPAASDLRLIVAIIKTITDLERIGDEAEKIGYLATSLAEQERPENRYAELDNMAAHVRKMLRDALDSFARMDGETALQVAGQDERIDREYEGIIRQSITFMMEDPRTIKRVLNVMWCARALERIGDHSKNICEYVVYLVHGKDIRHLDLKAAGQKLRGD